MARGKGFEPLRPLGHWITRGSRVQRVTALPTPQAEKNYLSPFINVLFRNFDGEIQMKPDKEVIEVANEKELVLLATRKPGEESCERCFTHR